MQLFPLKYFKPKSSWNCIHTRLLILNIFNGGSKCSNLNPQRCSHILLLTVHLSILSFDHAGFIWHAGFARETYAITGSTAPRETSRDTVQAALFNFQAGNTTWNVNSSHNLPQYYKHVRMICCTTGAQISKQIVRNGRNGYHNNDILNSVLLNWTRYDRCILNIRSTVLEMASFTCTTVYSRFDQIDLR